MPLPKISTPTYELTIPSSERKIKYRPFLVKEEKILIIAMESQDDKQIAQAVKDVLGSCILTKGISVDKLSTFDISKRRMLKRMQKKIVLYLMVYQITLVLTTI